MDSNCTGSLRCVASAASTSASARARACPDARCERDCLRCLRVSSLVAGISPSSSLCAPNDSNSNVGTPPRAESSGRSA